MISSLLWHVLKISLRTIRVSAEETTRKDDAKAVLRKIKSKSFVLGLSGTSDVNENFGHIANLCQKVDILPHERYDSVMRGVDHFAHMLSAVSHSQCQDVIMERKSSGKMDQSSSMICLWPMYHVCLEEFGSDGAFKGVVINSEHETNSCNMSFILIKIGLVLCVWVLLVGVF